MTDQADMKWDDVEGVESLASGSMLFEQGEHRAHVTVVSPNLAGMARESIRIKDALDQIGWHRVFTYEPWEVGSRDPRTTNE